ncbi:MAG: class I SAM-dependent methyltransferase [Candidatus Acidoferrales bacterium]
MSNDALFILHSGLPREGPGSNASTLEAIRRLPPLPSAPRIVDIGCGPGKQTLVLARTFRAPVIAVDIHEPYLEQLKEAAVKTGLSQFIETRNVSMDALDLPAESIDLIWSEGAAYILGVSRALRVWRPFLRAGGLVAFTEATWLTEAPPEEAAAFFREEYPEMATVDENRRRAGAAGYEVSDAFALPLEDWWTEYYTPLRERITALRARGDRDADLAAEMEATEREIDIYTRYGDSFGYVFYLLRKKG